MARSVVDVSWKASESTQYQPTPCPHVSSDARGQT